ncbi:MAG: hypothetical protein RL653_1256 [Pseudomonadota bacterium]|jgi:hypothetical protein
MTPETLPSLAGVVDVTVHHPAGEPRGWVLFEVPHGATRTQDYRRVEGQLKGKLPADLVHFFYVNTDIGAPEAAELAARQLCEAGVGAVVARCLLPRTFVDTNRVLDGATGGKLKDGLTPGLPGYITHPEDAAWLSARHAEYTDVVRKAYEAICGERRGFAVQVHSYAPKSVGVSATDDNIVAALHAAYEPDAYAKWPERPVVDLITATADGSFRAAPALSDSIKAAYRAAGIPAEENATYHMHPITQGMAWAKAYPQQVTCVELNRGVVSAPFTPFGESPLSAEGVAKLTAPLVQALLGAVATAR